MARTPMGVCCWIKLGGWGAIGIPVVGVKSVFLLTRGDTSVLDVLLLWVGFSVLDVHRIACWEPGLADEVAFNIFAVFVEASSTAECGFLVDVAASPSSFGVEADLRRG